MKKSIFFDLYGTLIDIITDEFDPWVYSTLSHYLSYHLIKIAPEEFKRTYFEEIELHLKKDNEPYPEVDVHNIFSNVAQRYGNREYSESVIADIAMLFRSLTIRRFGTFARVYDVLGSLTGKYELAIISDAQWIFAEPEMAMLDLTRFFKFTILSSRFGFKKPDVRLFDTAMGRLMAKPAESIYIGDNPQKDLIGAKRAGMKFILFGAENKFRNDFQPDGHFSDYSELVKIIEDL